MINNHLLMENNQLKNKLLINNHQPSKNKLNQNNKKYLLNSLQWVIWIWMVWIQTFNNKWWTNKTQIWYKWIQDRCIKWIQEWWVTPTKCNKWTQWRCRDNLSCNNNNSMPTKWAERTNRDTILIRLKLMNSLCLRNLR